jgi:hypothetical protein
MMGEPIFSEWKSVNGKQRAFLHFHISPDFQILAIDKKKNRSVGLRSVFQFSNRSSH